MLNFKESHIDRNGRRGARVGAAVCMRDAASEGVVARVDASTVRVECAWGSAEFPAPSPAPAVGGAVALPGPCAGVVVQIEGDAVVVRAAWGSWRAAWARVGARGFGPPGTCADDVEAELAALARRKSGEAADIYEATARDVAGHASVALAAERARNSESGDPEPVVALTRCDVAIDDLELTMDEHRFSWVFNSLAGLFRDQIRDFVCEALRDLVVDKSRDLLEPINALLGASWAPLRRALDLPDVCDLPRLEGDCAAGGVGVTPGTGAPGPRARAAPDDPRHLAVAGLVAGGQCAAALAQQGFSADDVAGAIGVGGAGARTRARDDTVVRVTSPARPRVLGLELAPGARPRARARRGGGRGGSARTSSSSALSPPGRRAETIGLKLKTHGTMTEACPQNLADRGFAPGLALVAVGDAAVSPRTDAIADVKPAPADRAKTTRRGAPSSWRTTSTAVGDASAASALALFGGNASLAAALKELRSPPVVYDCRFVRDARGGSSRPAL
ncbi:hypothetical protein SO694_00115069 [Aureococcus anophagefferens]|uniref:Uncharacterized protein n=1 Tax=Aureococcus anophagefferens TaxID=44056 RepID=A0ABR1FWR4_AURAN